MRGSLVAEEDGWGEMGSIPACAGEPPTKHNPVFYLRVDPRVCGGATIGKNP